MKSKNDCIFPAFIRLMLLVLFLTTMSFKMYSQTIIFDHLNIEDGLSELTVQAIYQDEFGRMWIATKDGLNLYDGKTVEVFRPIIGDTTSIMGHNILNVTGNRHGSIYIHCMTGVLRYDMREERFHILLSEGIERIAMGKEHLWASHRNEIYYLDNNTNKFILYRTLDKGINITSILEGENNELYLGTRENGLITLDKDRKISSILNHDNIICIFRDSRKILWVGTLKSGLYKVDPLGHISNYKHDSLNKNSISNNFVRAINEDNTGKIWIGTFEGLNKLDVLQEQFSRFYHGEQIRYSLGSNSIWSITKDIQGSLWIGSYYGGVDIFNPDYLFNFYSTVSNGSTGLCDGVVGRIAEDKEGNMWICSENSGLNYFDRKKNTFQNYYNRDIGINTKVNASLKDIYYDNDYNCIWIGTHLDGLHKMNPTSRRADRIDFTDNTMGNDYVRCIIPYKKDKLLLGTHNSIYLFDKTTNMAKPLLSNEEFGLAEKQIWDMFIDYKGRFWFSTSSEIYCYKFETGKISTYRNEDSNPNSLQRGNLFVFAEDNEHRIWIGSAGGGISVFDDEKKSFTNFNTSNSKIIDNYVVDIVLSPNNNLIIATNKGISRFDLKGQTFKNYYNYDIFPFSGLKERSLHVTQSHELVVGGVYGMVIMNEKELDVEAKKYAINISRLYVNNDRVKPGDGTGILKQSIEYTDRIDLYSHKHTIFSVDFATSNYNKTIHPIIQYKLEGFDKEWTLASINDKITYTNLSPGSYKLIIKSGIEQNNTFSTYRELDIEIHPPFYKSVWAYIFYSALFIGAVILFFIYYSSHIRLKSSLVYAEKEKKHVEELNQMKLQFFTNISHELRTPITLIISQLESILRIGNLPMTISRKTLNILRNTDKMNRLVTEILDFRKQELGYLKLNISEQDIIKYIEEVCFPFREYAEEKEINFQQILSGSPVMVWFDKIQLEKVIYNILINAFRVTQKNGEIIVEVFKENESVTIRISDTGKGIPTDALPHIFNRFYQGDNKETQYQGAAGIGLALSKGIIDLHGGSLKAANGNTGAVFSISLLLGDRHFDYKKIKKLKTENTNIGKAETLVFDISLEKQLTDVNIHNGEIKEKYKILIVEDNPEVMNVLTDIFSLYYDVDTADNGMTGLEKAKEMQPDLILSDIMMPVMDGVELCKRIKSNLDTSHIPVILLTARADVEHIIFGLTNGADDYIIKPFNSNILLARCNNIINNRKSLQALYSHNPSVDIQMIAINEIDRQLLEKATQTVEDNFKNPDFNIDKFAKEMCLGRTNLFQKIKGITGQTPNDFILNIRLKKSLVLLKEHRDMPIYQIADMVGFDEHTYFMKCFKKHFGKTPSQYRNE